MPNGEVYVEVQTLDAHRPHPVVSRTALEIHVLAVTGSVGTQTPDFVADEDLDTVGSADAVTVAAAELCVAGIWERRDGGYLVLDHDLVDNLLSYNGRAALRHGLSRKAIDVGCRWLKTLNSDRFIPL
jgi:hypothetical protein